MKKSILVATALFARLASAETVVDELLKSYEEIQSVTCFIRKDTEVQGQTITTLSKVLYQRPDHILVQNSSPVERQIVADGTNLYYYVKGDPKGFKQSISKLDKNWLIQLRKIPGTPMEHLLRLQGLKEDDLGIDVKYPVRKGYQAEHLYAVLSMDGEGRLARIEFYENKDMKKLTGKIDYEQFQKVSEHVSIPCLHRAVYYTGEVESHETSRVSSLVANKEVPAFFFNVGPFFKDVQFVSSMDDVYPK